MTDATLQDPRIRRTRRRLHQAVLALAEDRDLDTITVGDITTKADINRTTFYLHYRDKDDLVTQALDALFDEVTREDRAFADKHMRLSPEHVPAPIIALFRHLGERRELYRRLFVGGNAQSFAERLQLFEEMQFLRVWADMELTPAPSSPPTELRARMATSMIRGAIDWWLEGNQQETPEVMAQWLWTLIAPLWFTNTAPPPLERIPDQ